MTSTKLALALGPHVGSNWECPYCSHAQVLGEKRMDLDGISLQVNGWNKGDDPRLLVRTIICTNNKCREMTLEAMLKATPYKKNPEDKPEEYVFKSWALLPSSSAKPQPNYIPKQIRDDYYEACAIRIFSPKASATITRRCLQGMIRDFCDISKSRLIDEIKELRERVDNGHAPAGVQPDTMDAIDNIRKMGNIGAHMEKDINVIVDVDPNEAQTLIGLVELLLSEWYVARATRQERLAKLSSIAAGKEDQKKGIASSPKETSNDERS